MLLQRSHGRDRAEAVSWSVEISTKPRRAADPLGLSRDEAGLFDWATAIWCGPQAASSPRYSTYGRKSLSLNSSGRLASMQAVAMIPSIVLRTVMPRRLSSR